MSKLKNKYGTIQSVGLDPSLRKVITQDNIDAEFPKLPGEDTVGQLARDNAKKFGIPPKHKTRILERLAKCEHQRETQKKHRKNTWLQGLISLLSPFKRR